LLIARDADLSISESVESADTVSAAEAELTLLEEFSKSSPGDDGYTPQPATPALLSVLSTLVAQADSADESLLRGDYDVAYVGVQDPVQIETASDADNLAMGTDATLLDIEDVRALIQPNDLQEEMAELRRESGFERLMAELGHQDDVRADYESGHSSTPDT
jgi:hypothetical protein